MRPMGNRCPACCRWFHGPKAVAALKGTDRPGRKWCHARPVSTAFGLAELYGPLRTPTRAAAAKVVLFFHGLRRPWPH